MNAMLRSRALFLAPLLAIACQSDRSPAPAGSSSTGSPAPPASAAAAPSAVADARPPDVAPPPPREGGALVRSTRGDVLYLADEDRSAVRVIQLPIDEARASVKVAMPGRPAQVLAVRDRVLVTIRDPGLLLVLAPDAERGLTEVARVVVPADAWGLAVTPDGMTAVVTSAWTHQVTAVDLGTNTVRFSLDVQREPRAVAVRPDGKVAYVSHLVGSALTKVSLEGGGAVSRVDLPASPLRSPRDVSLPASLGWALAISADGKRLFAARHALGAPGQASWFGAPTIDVLLLDKEQPLALPRKGTPVAKSAIDNDLSDPVLATALPDLVQPRALAVRASKRTLLVASEGKHALFELEALAIDPAANALHVWRLGSAADPTEPAPTRCGAPTGIALSVDEATAYVFCRTTGDLAIVDLDRPHVAAHKARVIHLADDPLGPVAARGRRVFFDAEDPITSGGSGCAGCHPDGRDDGHVWMEARGPMTEAPIFVGGPAILEDGYARQTPMLAGRVAAEGPYGWHAQSDDLQARVLEGMRLHRWVNPEKPWVMLEDATQQRAAALAEFLRAGLVPPPRPAAQLSTDEQRGRDLFASAETGCAGCHVPQTGFTNRVAVPFKLPGPSAGHILEDPSNTFMTPSLAFVGGTAPYLHDGSVGTLEQLIQTNDDRMGKTNHLSEKDRAALVAYLKTL